MLLDRANSIDLSLVEPPGEAKSIGRENTFAKDTRNSTLLKATLRYLGEQVGSTLRKSSKQAKYVSIKVSYANFSTITYQQTLKRPTDIDQLIFNIGNKLIDRELAREKQPIRIIGIDVSSLVEAVKKADMLEPSIQKLERINSIIDRIRNKYGFGAIKMGTYYC